MGLSNKLATKIRTAGRTIPVQLPEPWEDRGLLFVLIGLRSPDRPVDVLAVAWATAAASVRRSRRPPPNPQKTYLEIIGQLGVPT
jgi:hypothetical protein